MDAFADRHSAARRRARYATASASSGPSSPTSLGRGVLLAVLIVAAVATLLAMAAPARAAEDKTPPQITALSITPAEVNTESASQALTVTMTLTDDQAGVSTWGDMGSSNFTTQITLSPLIGSQTASGQLTRISGDALDGVYSATITLPPGSKEGVWDVYDLFLVDKLGNYVQLNANELNSLLPAADGLVVVNTATAQQVTIDRQWTLSTANSSVTFAAGTVVTRADDGRFAFYQMAAQTFTLDNSMPTTDLDGTPVATLQFGIPGLNLSFDRPVSVTMNVGSAYNGYRLNIQSLTVGAAAWANETTCDVLGGYCHFTVSHATHFVASAARPTITKIAAASAKRRAIVTIIGKGFGAKRGSAAVKFGAKTCTRFLSWSSTRIRCRVPATAKFGTIKVTVKNKGGVSKAKSFKVKR